MFFWLTYPNLFGIGLFFCLTYPNFFGRSRFETNDRKCTKIIFYRLLPTYLGYVCSGLLHIPKHLGYVTLHLGEVRFKFTCLSQTVLTYPNFYDMSQLQPECPRSPWLFIFSKGQSVPVSHTSPNFFCNFCLYLTSPNFFGRSHFTFTHLSQLFWDKYVCFLTSPNFFGICQAKVGICHNKLGEVIFFSMTESALKFFLHTYPNFFGISMFVF